MAEQNVIGYGIKILRVRYKKEDQLGRQWLSHKHLQSIKDFLNLLSMTKKYKEQSEKYEEELEQYTRSARYINDNIINFTDLSDADKFACTINNIRKLRGTDKILLYIVFPF